METVHLFAHRRNLPRGTEIIDTVPGALRELCIIRNPSLKFADPGAAKRACKTFARQHCRMPTVLAYYPWKKTAVRLPNEEVYFELRTARNKNIITEAEQKKYREAHVGIIGLSVGSNVLSALVLSGGPKFLKIADYDAVAISNLNRLRAPAWTVGANKAVVAARAVWELDPFARIEVWENGVSEKTLGKFMTRTFRLDMLIDEMDDLALKIHARLYCRARRIPVIMATDNGDNIILDIERFDKEPKRLIFHGLLGRAPLRTSGPLSYSQWLRLAVRIVDPKNLTPRMQESLRQIGKTLAGVPQLGTTATIAGAAVAYAVRKISVGDRLPSGRYFMKLDAIARKGVR